MMHAFGNTRSASYHDHILHTPDTFVRAPLPGMRNATAVVHATPAMGARFIWYTAEFEPGGVVPMTQHQRFIFVLEGEIETHRFEVHAGEYAWFPPAVKLELRAAGQARVAVIEKPYQPLAGFELGAPFRGRESDVAASPLAGDSAVEVRSLIPSSLAFDLAVNTMTFQPGATLPMVEMHVMEHGLVMLSGAGIYRLGDKWYPVAEGDFIWMAPHLPQWFGALGKTPTKYLIYKDWNR